MKDDRFSRRGLLRTTAGGVIAATAAASGLRSRRAEADAAAETTQRRGAQRLSLAQLVRWEALGYGMFIHFGMSTFVRKELPDGKAPPTRYAPDRLDVDQWISVARDAGMKYAVLTAKHVAGHCLWPSRHTTYTVANSADKADVVERFVKACEKRGVLAGLYYCSWDNHNRFGSRTPSDPHMQWNWKQDRYAEMERKTHADANALLPPYTTSVYQGFQTAQITELLTQYGPIAETWIDIPGVLGAGYRTFLYRRIAELQPETVIMMNSGISTGETYDVDYAWPSDLIAIERRLPPESGHRKWRTIEGKEYYMPGEVCDPIGKEWFFVPGDTPRADAVLADQVQACRARGVNLLLDVPPDEHGLIPEEYVQALMRLRKNAKL
ncbi:MAG: alpha-L-fucosidase [Phycisphaerae bacterium]